MFGVFWGKIVVTGEMFWGRNCNFFHLFRIRGDFYEKSQFEILLSLNSVNCILNFEFITSKIKILFSLRKVSSLDNFVDF